MKPIMQNYPLSELTTFKIGGKADYFSMPSCGSEIIKALDFARQRGLKTFILGGGANILVSDNGFRGMVISTAKLKKLKFDDGLVTAEAGLAVDVLNAKVARKSLSGMEFSAGLPGSLGGAVFMNAKAYGGDFAEITEFVEIINERLASEKLVKSHLEYSYKSSVFMKRKGVFIYRIGLRLNRGNKKQIEYLYEKNRNDRMIKGHYEFPSAGCIFKNNYDIGIPTGKIIEELGLKGMGVGDAEVFKRHANFIVNKRNAKASDVLRLIEMVEKSVYEKKGIRLEREVQLLGFDD